jgi:hypothetical protein
MVESLCFEICKPDQRSRYICIEVDEDGVYLSTAFGHRGMYAEDAALHYRASLRWASRISDYLRLLKIYSWPKSVPSDYVPGKHMLGCDDDSWSLDYKEMEKSNTRHIHGKGSMPDISPYSDFIQFIDRISPDQDWLEWIDR